VKDLVSVVEAKHVAEHRLHLRFSDGSEKTVDLSPWLRGKLFSELRDLRSFKRFFLAGGTVCWPNGAEIAPERLRAAKEISASAA
jgi:Protein of unknown function (DUF2442)